MTQQPDHNPHSNRRAWIGVAIYGSILLTLCVLINLEDISSFLNKILDLLRPILWGLVLSYLINPIFRFFERKAFSKLRFSGLRRSLALILSYLSFFLLIALVLALLLPELILSLTNFFSKLGDYTASAIATFNTLVVKLNDRLNAAGIHQNLLQPLDAESIGFSMNSLMENLDEIMAWAEPFLSPNGSFSVGKWLGNLFSGITDLIFAFFVSIYLLSTKERRYAQIMKLRNAIFNHRTNEFITRVCTVANSCFGNFILGKLAESVLIGVTAYLTFLLFKIPYALLIAVIGAIANLIPFVGPILGLIPALVIVLLAEPSKALTLVLIVFFLQQLDKNLINPRMLDRYNISYLAVLIAVTSVGIPFGLPGLLLCVPLFATVMALLDESAERRLRQKGLLSSLENYYPSDSMVNPSKDTRKTSDTAMKRFERHVLEIRSKQEKGLPVSKWEDTSLRLYQYLIRHRIIPELSNEIRMQFTAESIEKNAEEEVETLIKQLHGIDLLEKNSEQKGSV